MGALIYSLCAAAALACATLLLRAFSRSGYRLLLWSGLCFAGLTMNNLLLVLDKIVFPTARRFVRRSIERRPGGPSRSFCSA